MKQQQIKVLVYRVGKEPAIEMVENELEPQQKIVGGYIEPVHLGNGILAIVNEEGLLLGLKPNRMFVGDFFVCRSAGEEFSSLTENDIELVKRKVV